MPFVRIRTAALLLMAAVAGAGGVESGCGSKIEPGPPTGPPGCNITSPAYSGCAASLTTCSVTAAFHRPVGSPLTFSTNPPIGGDHYPIWVKWGTHSTAIARGFWVHNLEHGGVVYLYRCASRAACPDIAAKLESIAAALPQDPICSPPVRARVIVVPDPELPATAPIAVVSWGASLTATCIDPTALRNFYLQHFGHGSEDVCADGEIIEEPPPDAGG